MPPVLKDRVETDTFDQIANNLIQIPAFPPDEWVEPLSDDIEPYDVIVEPNGHIHGFPAASWNDCHLSYPDECVTPPRSMTDYALFKVGQLTTASGKVVRTGPLTLKGGHAPHGVSRQAAQKYYDDTMSAFADVNIGDGKRGMWINGALRPDTTVADVRRAMSSGFSGDWREWQGNLELIAFSAVNTPGFRRKAAVWKDQRLVASASTDGWGSLRAAIDMPRTITAAGVVIRALDTGRLLMTQRSWFHGDDDETKGKWEFPGGNLDEGEDAEMGALRELNEETGLVLPDNWAKVGDYPTGNYVAILFDVPSEGWSQAAQLLANEVIGIGWFDPSVVSAISRPECRDFDADAVWAEMNEQVVVDSDAVMASAADRIARTIGRSRHQIAEQLRSRVHGGR